MISLSIPSYVVPKHLDAITELVIAWLECRPVMKNT